MMLRLTPGEATVDAALIASLSAVAGWLSNIWLKRGDQRIEVAKLTIDREDAINARVDGIFRAYDARITDMQREIGECRAELGALRSQMRENDEARDLAEIAASTAGARADELYVLSQGLQAQLTQCNEQNAKLLHQLAERPATKAGDNGHVKEETTPDREA
jgi:Skp family chaperone for outer membrane proteins